MADDSLHTGNMRHATAGREIERHLREETGLARQLHDIHHRRHPLRDGPVHGPADCRPCDWRTGRRGHDRHRLDPHHGSGAQDRGCELEKLHQRGLDVGKKSRRADGGFLDGQRGMEVVVLGPGAANAHRHRTRELWPSESH